MERDEGVESKSGESLLGVDLAGVWNVDHGAVGSNVEVEWTLQNAGLRCRARTDGSQPQSIRNPLDGCCRSDVALDWCPAGRGSIPYGRIVRREGGLAGWLAGLCRLSFFRRGDGPGGVEGGQREQRDDCFWSIVQIQRGREAGKGSECDEEEGSRYGVMWRGDGREEGTCTEYFLQQSSSTQHAVYSVGAACSPGSLCLCLCV